MKKALIILFILVGFVKSTVFAYDLVVTMLSGNISRQKQIGFELNANNPNDMSLISKGQLNLNDSTYRFNGLPNERLFITWVMNGGLWSEEVGAPTDSITILLNENESEIDVTNLNEVVVEGDNSYLPDEKKVYLPTSRDKKISVDGSTLLRNMAIASIYVSPVDETITTSSGDAVETYIDYVPASKTDISNIKTTDVQRVEVLDYPKDPRFRGAQHVVNFIMVKYEYGGYTRLNAAQKFVQTIGAYSGYSMLTNKRMTYDVGVNTKYSNSKQDYTFGKTEFKFPNQTVIYENQANKVNVKSRMLSAFFRALYRTDKTVISNIVGVSSSKAPNNYKSYNETFNTDDYESNASESVSDSKNTTVTWDGDYQFILPNEFSLVVNPSASYGSFNSDFNYKVGNSLSDVINNTKENAWSADIATTLSKNIKGNTYTIMLSGGANDNDMEYSGTTPSLVDAKYYHGGVSANTFFKFNKLTFHPSVTFYVDRTVFNGIGYTRYNPKYFITAGYLINTKNRLNFTSEMYYMSPTISQMGSNIQIQNQIEAITGNPELKTEIVNQFQVDYQCFALKNVAINAYCAYSRNSRLITSSYEPFSVNENNYMLRTLENVGFRNAYKYGVAGSTQLINNSLSLRAALECNSAIQHSEANYNITRVSFNAQATYSFSNAYVGFVYQSKRKSMMTWGTLERPQYYYFLLGWTYKNFNFRGFSISSFNSSYKGSTSYGMSNNRVSVMQSHSPSFHRSFEIGVTYTFSYGKKLNSISEASAPSGVQSGILK